ncbi:hypothetical protein AB0L85_29835 [Streptomyces sp. NPDC052051]|uniref:hypothetical protein n=1 Tax=Streptomyces sp. NPDC052051 TaxID=3154649 RepID=UPI0034211D33
MRSVLVKACVAVVAIGSLTACGGGSGDSGKSGESGKKNIFGRDKEPSAQASTADPLLKVEVPVGYDTSRGWQLSGQEVGTYGVLPKSDAIATMTVTGSAYRMTVRDAVSGKVRWTGKPFENLFEAQTPHMFVVPAGGREYLVAWSRGEKGGDAVAKAKKVYSVDIFAADGSGDAVAPTHHVDIPVSDYGTGTIIDAGAKLLVPKENDHKVVVDVATGRTTEYDTGSLKVNGCSSCNYGNEIAAVTERGPVVANEGAGMFGVPGAWSSKNSVPSQAESETGAVWPGGDGHLIARWDEKNDGGHNVWAALDSSTAKVEASVLCAKPFIGSGKAPEYALSPNGRYLVSEHLAFDLQAHKGYCFEETDDSKPLTFASVTDDGIAYGTSLTKSLSGTTAPVQLSLATGTPKGLPEEEQTPVADLAGVGVFDHSVGDERYLVVYRHKG